MSYIELIIVLSIFALMSSVVLYNHRGFQAKVDIKNLANDIALKIVEAQKSANFGSLPPSPQLGMIISGWKPSYGVHFDLSADNKRFIYFTDVNNNDVYEGSTCGGECLESITITKGNSISAIDVFYQGSSTGSSFSNMTISFARPSLGADFYSSSAFTSSINYIQITITSPDSASARIRVYPSGRIEIN